VRDATFCPADLTTFCRLNDLGLEVTGQQLHPDHALLLCRVVESDDWCHACGAQGVARDTVLRRVAHVPLGWRATILHIRVRRYRCTGCGHVWRQDTNGAAAPRAKLSTQAVLWALKSVVIDRMSIARIAANLGVSWHTVNDAVLATGHQLLIADPTRLDGVRVIGVDEHAWRHTRRGDKYVTVIIDLTPIHEGTGPSRLLDMVEGRSKAVFKTWLEAQTPAFRAGVEVVAMDGFTGFKTAAAEELPDAVAVMDPFHVVALAGDALDRCRQRVQQDTCGHRGRVGDPLYGIRRVLRTGVELLTDRQHARLTAVFAAVIASIGKDVPTALTELTRLGRTLTQRASDVLAYFDRPGTSNGPTEAINGRLEHLRGTALGFRNLSNYITRSLLDTGGFRPRLHPLLR
jgi:transposase